MARRGVDREAGLVTAEYAVATVAACGFGALLLKLVTGDGMVGLVMKLLTSALDLAT